MRRRVTLALLASLALVAARRPESRADPHQPVVPPVDSPTAIPVGPVNGTVRGAPFTMRDARFIVDRRVGYAHTDIKLSAGKAATPCGPIVPDNAPSVWLRLAGDGKLDTQSLHIGEEAGAWSVHYQVFEPARGQWVGVSDASALVTLRAPGADGLLQGGLAVCFSDNAKSCVSGSFTAQNCPSSLDMPVRGAQPPETIPEKYRLMMSDAGAAPDK